MNAAQLRSKLESPTISPSILLGTAKLLEESSRDSPSFNDPRYLPFYYHLGRQLTPSRVVQIGSKLGLIASCFLQGCKTVTEWLVMDPAAESRPPASIITSNIKMHSKAVANFMVLNENNLDKGGEYDIDLALLTEKYEKGKATKYMDFFWSHLKSEGLLVVDYIQDDHVKDEFHGFCRVKNREPLCFDTRYGVGVVIR